MDKIDFLKERRLFPRISMAFPTVVSPEIRGDTVNLSETGLCLSLEEPIGLSRTISFQIDLPFSQSLESQAQLVWTKNVAENDRYLCGLQFLRLKENKLSILREALFKSKFLNNNFISLTKKLRYSLSNIKKEFDVSDTTSNDEFKRDQFIKKNKLRIFNELDRHFEKVWEIVKNFSKEEYHLHQKYYQGMLYNLLLDPIETNRYIYQKPLGYSGDYMIMNYFYDFHNKYLGQSSYQKLINLYTCNVPIAKSVVRRKDFLKGKILETLNNSRKKIVNVLSIGSGPVRELIELVQEDEIAKPFYFDCLDFDKKALDYLHKEIETIDPIKKSHLYLKFINKNLLELIKNKNGELNFKKYDFIYSAGVFDYLSDRIAGKLLNILCNFLNKNSELIICNAARDIASHRVYYEMLGGWSLTHRTEKEVSSWVKDIQDIREAKFENLSEKNSFLILSLKKTAK